MLTPMCKDVGGHKVGMDVWNDGGKDKIVPGSLRIDDQYVSSVEEIPENVIAGLDLETLRFVLIAVGLSPGLIEEMMGLT